WMGICSCGAKCAGTINACVSRSRKTPSPWATLDPGGTSCSGLQASAADSDCLDPNVIGAARVGALMLTRWRRENFFKYARANLGLAALPAYAAETAIDRHGPNPAVKAARAELKRLRTAVQNVRAALGRTVVLELIQPTATDDRPAETPSDAMDQPTVTSKRTPATDPARRAALMTE